MSGSGVEPIILLFALIWGGIWASFLQISALGQFLARKRTWLTVVVGVGVDLVLAAVVVPLPAMLIVCAIFALSGMPIVLRSILNEHAETVETIRAIKDQAA